MRLIFTFFVGIFLLACASKYESLSLPQFSQKSFSLSADEKSYILSVARVSDEVKFVLIDSFGSPIARRILSQNKFKNVGFLPPTSKYDELFIKVLDLIKDNAKTAFVSFLGKRFFIRQLDDISI